MLCVWSVMLCVRGSSGWCEREREGESGLGFGGFGEGDLGD